MKVYALRNQSSPSIYIGTTTKRLLCERLAEHRADFKRGRGISSRLIVACPTATIELLEDLGDCDKATQKERERWWIRNTPNCVNECKLQTEEERRVAGNRATVAYHKQNRERHNAYQREYAKRRKATT